MAIDPDVLLSLPPLETRHDFTERDTILYALGVGACELPFVYEESLKALPTMASVMAYPGFIWKDERYGADWRRVLHAEHSIEIKAPLPVRGSLCGVTTLGPIFDKGADKGAVVHQTREIFDGAAQHIATIRAVSFLRGDGGFGGDAAGQPKPRATPERSPDQSINLTTAQSQALLYRLSGDYNPLHISPKVATAAGFPKPILHGLCTFGFAGRALLASLCGNEPERLIKMSARFSSPVYPGETISVDIWREGAGRSAFRASVTERNALVLSHGFVEHL